MTVFYCSGQFQVACDSEVVESNLLGEFTGVSAVVRYITLHDTRARGFVRPVCVAYLTWDGRKLDTALHTIRRRMAKVKSVCICFMRLYKFSISL